MYEVNWEGNDVTKRQILLQELTFSPGDTIPAEDLEKELEESRKRLFNLRLFHYVTYSYTCQEGQVQVLYKVQERFYLYPFPILDFADRNFNAWLEKKDWSRIDYGFNLIRRNFRGRNEDVRLRVQRGFNKRLELSYRVPYINRAHNLGFEVGVSDYRSRTINYNTLRNRQYFLEQEEGMPIKRTAFFGTVIHRQSVQRQDFFRVVYGQEAIADTVAQINPEYFRQAETERQYMRFEVAKVINLRNTFAYPLTGSYFEAAIGQTFFFNNSGFPITTVRAKYVDYLKIADKYYYSIGVEGQLKLSKNYAYTDNNALGFRSLVRGYELYVVGGQHYALLKQGLTRELFNIKAIRLKFIDNPKLNNIPLALYFNAFSDAGYTVDDVYAQNNPLTNRLLIGGGLGLHVVTFYDMVLRLEYSVNREGNRGFYFSGRFPF